MGQTDGRTLDRYMTLTAECDQHNDNAKWSPSFIIVKGKTYKFPLSCSTR